MKNHLIIQNICLLTSITCLGLPYILAGYWLVMLFFFTMAAFWLMAKNRSVSWSASILLFIFVLLAAIGVLANLSIPLMVIGSAAALAWWDLTHFGQSTVIGQSLDTRLLLERTHLQSLALAISAGLLLAFLTSYLNLQIPFLGTVFLVLLAVGCLTYGLQTLANTDH